MDIQKEIKKLKKRLELLEEQAENETFELQKPKKGDTFFLTSDAGLIHEFVWYDDECDQDFFSYGNVFKTRKDAERALRIRQNTQKLKQIALRLNRGKKIDWKNTNQKKYYIFGFYNDMDFKFKSILTFVYKEQGTIYCLDEDFLDVALKEIGKESLKEVVMEEEE